MAGGGQGPAPWPGGVGLGLASTIQHSPWAWVPSAVPSSYHQCSASSRRASLGAEQLAGALLCG